MNPDSQDPVEPIPILEDLKVDIPEENATEAEAEDGYETEEDDEEIEEEEEDEDEDDNDNEVQNILAVADLSAPIANEESLDEKQCWICFGTEADDPAASWIHPCK